MRLIHKCKHCGNEFPHVKGWKLGEICSASCNAQHSRRRKHPERFNAVRNCAECGKEFRPHPKVATVQKVCSDACGKRLWYRQNKARVDAMRGQWAKDNRQKQLAYAKKSRSKKPEHYQAVRRLAEERRRVRANSCEGSYTVEEWNALKALYDNRCLRCHRQEPEIELTVDHVVPLSVGGRNSIDNLQPLCRSCNTYKHVKTIDYRPECRPLTRNSSAGSINTICSISAESYQRTPPASGNPATGI